MQKTKIILFEFFNITHINIIYEEIVKNTDYLKDIARKTEIIKDLNVISNIALKTVKTSSKLDEGEYKGKAYSIYAF